MNLPLVLAVLCTLGVSLQPRDGGGDRIVSIVPLSGSRLLNRGTIMSSGEPKRTIDLGETHMPVYVEPVLDDSGQIEAGAEIGFELRLREGDPPMPNNPICIFALHRPERTDKPFRRMRLVD